MEDELKERCSEIYMLNVDIDEVNAIVNNITQPFKYRYDCLNFSWLLVCKDNLPKLIQHFGW